VTPDPFAEVRGQDEAVAVLRRAVAAGRIAHAYAFVGPPGSGRRAAALALAKALHAADPGAAARIDRGAHPDVRVIAPVPPEDRPKGPLAIRIDLVREVEKLASLRASAGAWKVFVVDEAERMTGAAPQAFLKTLEEPPARTVIVLVLTRLRGLPPTVLSRCQVVRFRPQADARGLALLPDGRDEARVRALAVLDGARRDGVVKAGEAVERDRGAAEQVIEACWLLYRDLLCAHAGAPAAGLVFGDRALAAARQVSPDRALAGIGACREAWHALAGNATPRLTVEVMLARLLGLAA
jgi:DNA polymerase-3 subunit delta'